ncbi:MAG: phage tail protein [Myxococcales bacterium]|nr:phage tail protein [Myxococcales bacterium]MCB9670642.1 phage tail protein [Alphaproteobacteria bacterium]MCB9693796.1 phage tail protein [Alphaproteobacteria bacterium]
MAVQFDLQTDNYVGTHNFQVIIDEIEVLNSEFVSVSGVVSESEEIEFMHGTDPYVRRGAGRVTYEPVVMERVYKGMDEFYGWRLECENGNIERKNVTVTMMDASFTPVRAMTLEGAWPSKWEMPDMDASSSGPAIERITLTVERVRESEPG